MQYKLSPTDISVDMWLPKSSDKVSNIEKEFPVIVAEPHKPIYNIGDKVTVDIVDDAGKVINKGITGTIVDAEEEFEHYEATVEFGNGQTFIIDEDDLEAGKVYTTTDLHPAKKEEEPRQENTDEGIYGIKDPDKEEEKKAYTESERLHWASYYNSHTEQVNSAYKVKSIEEFLTKISSVDNFVRRKIKASVDDMKLKKIYRG